MDNSGDPVESLTITQTTQSDALILHLAGELDLPTAGITRTALLHATNALPPPWRVVLDLSALRFLSAAGLRALYHLIDACAKRDINVLVVVDGTGIVPKILRVAPPTHALPVFTDVEQALGADN